MGWKGAIRSIGAAVRAAERDAARRHKAEIKDQISSDSAQAVAAWENFLESLVKVHANLAERIDWRAMASKPRPPEPVIGDANQRAAHNALANFKPGAFDAFRGGSKKLRQRLENDVSIAPETDARAYAEATAAHQAAMVEWEADTGLARRLIEGDVEATKTVINEMQAGMQGDGYIGTQIFYHIEPNYLHATPIVHGIDVIPAYRRKQLSSGRLSETKMPVGELNELYQDYVSSVALKVAGDLLHILPIEEVYVTCEAEMVNKQTGHKEKTPILSVQVVRSTFAKLNLSNLDPSDAMGNFRHNMAFKRAHGFSRVEQLAPIARAN